MAITNPNALIGRRSNDEALVDVSGEVRRQEIEVTGLPESG